MDSIGAILMLAIVGVIYFLPSLIAWKRDHRQGAAIMALNILLGWTFLGWVAALVWALVTEQARAAPAAPPAVPPPVDNGPMYPKALDAVRAERRERLGQ